MVYVLKGSIMANRQELVRMVVELLHKIQEISGREIPSHMTERTIPIGGLPGFDSLNGIELTVMLPESVRWSGRNLCVSEDGRKALSIGEIADRLLNSAGGQATEVHGHEEKQQ
jgi:hypothetical protein